MIEFTKKDNYDFYDLIKIMEILRVNCPWDKEQTHHSIKRNFIEETYEVIDAIENGDDKSLKEELGDVLLQVVFHTQIASEENRFKIDDVTSEICKKLIHRHPHIFSNVEAKSSDEVLNNWAEIKKQEKGQKSTGEVIKNITKHLPSLLFAYKIQREVAKTGFDFNNIDDTFSKLDEEVSELRQAISKNDIINIEEECGDVLFSVVNILRKYNIDPELALMKTNKKFTDRYLYIEKYAKLRYNVPVEELSIQQMDKLWDEYKNTDKAQ